MHHALASALIAFAVLIAPDVDSADCGGVEAHYSASVAAVAKALGAYARCVATSDRRDDCAAQIQALDNAHDNFVDAVDDAKDCR